MKLRFWKRKPVVATTIAAGLGNQMFQYAVSRSIALKNKAELLLILGDRFDPGAHRNFGLQNFAIAGRVMPDAPPLPEVREITNWNAVTNDGQPADMRFMPTLRNWRGSIHLTGYWQDERYFADKARQIRRDFSLKAPLQGRNLALSKRIRNGNSAFLHVRRADYLVPGNAEFYGALEPAYYERALAALRTRSGDDLQIFVFSDDPDWVRETRIGGPTAEIIDWNAATPWHDLALMRACRHAVIANSSFSWWGAWLGEAPGGTVVAPRIWYKGVPAYHEIVPTRWLRL